MEKQIRYAAAKWNDLDNFTTVTMERKGVSDEMETLRRENFDLKLRLYCKNEAKQQQIKEYSKKLFCESPDVISTLRQELKLKTNQLIKANSATAKHKDSIAQNEVKIAELESYIAKLESTADDLTAAKMQIKVLGEELKDRDETVFSCEAKIQELAVNNSNLIARLHAHENNLKTKNQIRYSDAKWYGKSRFSVVTKANRQIHDENMYLNHCKDKGEDQYIKELCAAQVKKLNVAITNLREELKLKTNLLIQAAAEQTECIAKNEMKIAELQLYSDKLESTVDELKEAKRQIEILGKQLEMRDETVVSFESKIKELALKNSKLINRAHTYNNKLKTKELLKTQKKLLARNLAEKQKIMKLLTALDSALGYHKNLVGNSAASVQQDDISYHQAMARNRLERNEHLIRSLTKENKNYKLDYFLRNLRFNYLLETMPKIVLNSFLNPSESLLLCSSPVPSVDNDLGGSSGIKTNEGFWSALRYAFLRLRDRVSKALI